MSATFKFDNVRISGLAAVVAENEIRIDDEQAYYPDAEALQRLKKTIGFDRRRVANSTTTTADMCRQAASRLMQKMRLSPDDFEAIISVTQTPDYYMPGNAHIIHRDLGFPQTCIAYDLEFGCSGFINGLFMACMMAEKGVKRVLLLTGDTLSKIINIKNRADAPVFGDAGSAAVIEVSKEKVPSYFCLCSDGRGADMMIKKAGAYRIPTSEETQKEIADSKGNISSQENFFMNGFEVFNFTMTEQPKLLHEILRFSNKTPDEIDYFVMHQANKYIVETIAKKSGISLDKTPYRTFSEFGNQSSASIPVTICNELADDLNKNIRNVLLQGFGIGLSWGACQLQFDRPLILKPQIYGEKNE